MSEIKPHINQLIKQNPTLPLPTATPFGETNIPEPVKDILHDNI